MRGYAEHQALTCDEAHNEVFVFGAGTIGGALIDQIRDQREKLLSKNVDIRIMTISTVDGMFVEADGIDIGIYNK